MPPQIYDRNNLIAMLRYQFEIGIDEALLDFPDASAAPVTLREFYPPIDTTLDVAAKVPAGPMIDHNAG